MGEHHKRVIKTIQKRASGWRIRSLNLAPSRLNHWESQSSMRGVERPTRRLVKCGVGPKPADNVHLPFGVGDRRDGTCRLRERDDSEQEDEGQNHPTEGEQCGRFHLRLPELPA